MFWREPTDTQLGRAESTRHQRPDLVNPVVLRPFVVVVTGQRCVCPHTLALRAAVQRVQWNTERFSAQVLHSQLHTADGEAIVERGGQHLLMESPRLAWISANHQWSKYV